MLDVNFGRLPGGRRWRVGEVKSESAGRRGRARTKLNVYFGTRHPNHACNARMDFGGTGRISTENSCSAPYLAVFSCKQKAIKQKQLEHLIFFK